MHALCRDCEFWFDKGARCPSCRSPRVIQHHELETLSIAHVDCDAFYAAIEKRDNPEIRNRPVIVGGKKRGVVTTACYIARIYGVRSAMPMFKALKLCPNAVVLRPRMQVYVEVSKKIRALMLDLTPDVEPLSLDEAFLNLSGTSKLHQAPPSVLLVRLVNKMEKELGVTSSIGLSYNKFLAKIASDLKKPRGFSIIGVTETDNFLADKPIELIWGVGKVQREKLHQAGILTFKDLRNWGAEKLKTKFGTNGEKLHNLAWGKDLTPVTRRKAKSISNEVTFEKNISNSDILDGYLWRLSVKVADRVKAEHSAGRVVSLKLKRANFKLITRRRTLKIPTSLADQIYRNARQLMEAELKKTPFRLIGVGISQLNFTKNIIDEQMLDADSAQQLVAESTSDVLRERFGKDIIYKGRSLR